MAIKLTVNIKMFKVGELGDCFLLHFKDGSNESHVLIDCGSFRNSEKSKERLKEVVTEIKSQLKGKKLDVVVGTHQHNDHLSGFVHCEQQFTGHVNQVWLSWLDNPKDAFARKIQRDQKNLVHQLKGIYDKMIKIGINRNHQKINDVLGFFGISGNDPEIPAKGIEILKSLGENEVQYMSPGTITGIPGVNESTVKAYIFGPPRNRELLFDKDPSKGESYDFSLALAEASASKILSALDNYAGGQINTKEKQFPFDVSLKKKKGDIDESIRKIYQGTSEAWRKIDKTWLDGADRLALYLDSYTNNSSLVIAFELVKSGKILLFAADAQTGNWLSWDKIKWGKPGLKTSSLLENTVLYKVGHHGSHNATLVNALEMMNHPELVAMIPVDKTDPNITKKNGWKMPATNLYKRLKEKTHFRVLRMDDGFADDCDPKKNNTKSKWNELPFKPVVDKNKLFIEYTIQG
jgi:beta-lactamase superfamily II metal-dependent hydrolase